MSSHLTSIGSHNNIENLDRQQLIRRLLEVEEKFTASVHDGDCDESIKNYHNLQVHKVELEMQNRHMAETQLLLEESRNQYADLYEQCPAGLVTVSTSGRVIRANSTTAKALSQDKPHLLGSIFARFIVPEDRRRFTQGLDFCLNARNGEKVEVEASLWSGGGMKRMHLTMHRCESSENLSPAIAISMVDVTTQHHYNERVAFIASTGKQFSKNLELGTATATILKLAVPHLADFVAINFLGENLIDEGSAAEQLVGCDEGLWSPSDRDSINAILKQTNMCEMTVKTQEPTKWSSDCRSSLISPTQADMLAAHRLGQIQAWPLGRRGELLAVLWFAWSSVKSPQLLAAPSVLHDFVHRAALCLDNVNLYRLAQSQIKARSDFLAIVAHDLRNPLTVILMRAERMLHKSRLGDPAFIQKSAQGIGHCANKMATLVRDLLDSTSMDSRRLSMAPESLMVADVVRDELIGHQALIASKGINFISTIDGGAQVYCDPRRTNQVISNLIGNAVKFTESGGQITLRTQVLEEAVQFSVTDTGCGIADTEQARVFDLFWQAKQVKTVGHGAGLGLNICKKIVAASGGAIWFESVYGEGSTFHFTLPKRKPTVIKGSEALAEGAIILVVDDDPQYRENMVEVLTEQGYRVSCAENGQCAIDWIIAHGAPSLILLDLQMPVMDGLSFLKIRASNKSLTAIPVTILSSAVDEVSVETLSNTQVLWKMTPMQDVLRAIATVQNA